MIGVGTFCAVFPRAKTRGEYILDLSTIATGYPLRLSSLCIEARRGARLMQVTTGPFWLLDSRNDGISLDRRFDWRFPLRAKAVPLGPSSTIKLVIQGRFAVHAAAWFVPQPREGW